MTGKESLLEWKTDAQVIDVSHFDELYELIIASDFIISDYSSVAFDAGIINKKVFLYMPDLDEYLNERGINWSIPELPFPCSEDNDTFINQFNSFDEIDYRNRLKRFYDSLGIKETGRAAEIVADRIRTVIERD